MNDDRVVTLLEELVTWTRIGMYSAAETLLRKQFAESRPEERLAYELLDGNRSQKQVIEICKKSVEGAKISPAAISRWIVKWEKIGLVRRSESGSKKNFSLPDFGIEVPSVDSNGSDNG